MTKSSFFIDTFTGYNNKLITRTSNTKFLGIVIENSLPWKAHIDQLIPKLCTVCYTITATKPCISLDILYKVGVTFPLSLSYNCGIMFWGNSPCSIHVF
jgi:hypothetical protein